MLDINYHIIEYLVEAEMKNDISGIFTLYHLTNV